MSFEQNPLAERVIASMNCGHNIREWRCPEVWHHLDRDINAAKNLLAQPLRQLAGP
jgi:transposase